MQSNMKNLIKSMFFLIILGTLVFKMGVFLRPVDRDADVLEDFYEMEKNSVDVAFVGGSALFRYWIPALAYEEQGFTSAMLYCAQQDVSVIPYMIDELMKTQDPDVIFVENRRIISERVKEIDNELNEEKLNYFTQVMLSGMNPSLTKYKIINDVLKLDWGEKLEHMVPLLKYHDNIYEYSMDELIERSEDDMVDNIMELQIASVEELEFKQYSEEEYTDDVLTEKYLTMLDEIQKKGQEYEKRVVFLCMPYESSARGQTLRAQMRNYMDEKEYEYIDLTDVPDEMGLNFKTDFYNVSHTNIVGAEKVTSYLAQYIMKRFDIEAGHSLSVQSFWTDYISRWHEKEIILKEEWKKNCK